MSLNENLTTPSEGSVKINCHKFKIMNMDFEVSNKYSDTIGLWMFAVSSILYAVNAFLIKYIMVTFQDEYSPLLLSLWRSIFIFIISYTLIKFKGVEIIDVREVKNRFWFFVRTGGLFFAFISYVFAIEYLRVATVNSISALNPIIVLIFGTFIFREKFHFRYIVGFVICFLGALAIILNDRHEIKQEDRLQNKEIENDYTTSKILLGCGWSLVNLLIFSILSVSSKVLINENIGFENQNLFIGLTNSVLALVFMIFTGEFYIFASMKFMFWAFINGLTFFLGTLFLVESLKYIDLNKTTALAFLSTIISFILGVSFLGENIYFSDVLGSCVIITYNIYNAVYPIQ